MESARRENQKLVLTQALHNAQKAAGDALVTMVRGELRDVRTYIAEAHRLLSHAEQLLDIYEKESK